MKKYRLLLIPFICFLFLKLPLLNPWAYSEVTEEVFLDKVFTEEQIREIWGDYFLTLSTNQGKNLIKLYNNKSLVLTIEGIYQAHAWEKDYLWLATADYLYKISLHSFQAEKEAHSYGTINQMQIHDANLWLVGEKDNDALIVKMNYAFAELKTYSFGGEAFEQFTHLLWLNDIPYVIGQKDAHSLNGPFANVGSQGERKPFVCRLNRDFQIEQSVYFNHEAGSEHSFDAYINATGIYFLLQTKSAYHYYRLALDLTCTEHILWNDLEKIRGILSPSGFFVLLKETTEGVFWDVANQMVEDDKTIAKGQLIDFGIEEGCLVAYLKNGEEIIKKTIEEYHINQNEPLFLSYLDEEDLTKNIDVESYFEPLTVKVKEVDPFFVKTLPGEYLATYVVNRLNKKTIELTQKVIVLPYVNVINQGVYGIPFTLAFFGKGHLNGERILSGYTIETPGEYELVILDGYGFEETFLFYVVDNYPRKGGHILADYYVEKGKSVSVQVELAFFVEISQIIVNGSSHPFTQNDKTLMLELFPNEEGVTAFEITQAISNQGQVIPINKTLRTAVLRKAPEIIVKEEATDALKLTFDVRDPDNSLAALELVVYKNNQAIVTKQIFLVNEKLDLNLPEKGIYRIEINSLVERGNGIMQRKQLFIYQGYFAKTKVSFANITFNRSGRLIEEVILEVDTTSKSINPQEITVLSQNITSRYQKKSNYFTLTISLGLTALIVVLFGVNLLKKRRDKFREND